MFEAQRKGENNFGRVEKVFAEETFELDLEGEQFAESSSGIKIMCKVRYERMSYIPRMNFPITIQALKTCIARPNPVQIKPDTNPESLNRLPLGGRGFKLCQT